MGLPERYFLRLDFHQLGLKDIYKHINLIMWYGAPAGARTRDPRIKSPLLYHWATSAYGGFSHFRVFPCLVIIHTTNNPTLYANFALLLGNILGAFFNVVAPIHDVEQVMGIEPT